MVHQPTLTKIEQAARFLASPTAREARDYLAQPYQLALQILDCCSDGKPHTYEEIAQQAELSYHTVRQVLRSLQTGGYPLNISQAASSGRSSHVQIRSRR